MRIILETSKTGKIKKKSSKIKNLWCIFGIFILTKMSLIQVFVIISIFCAAQSQISQIKLPKSQETEVISAFISSICEDFFIEKSIKFEIIVYGTPTERINDITNGLVSKLFDKIPINYSSNRNLESEKFHIENSAFNYY